MSNEVVNWNVRDYKQNVELLLQTMGSQLRGAVMTDTYTGEGGRPVNQVGAVTAQEKTARHADTRCRLYADGDNNILSGRDATENASRIVGEKTVRRQLIAMF